MQIAPESIYIQVLFTMYTLIRIYLADGFLGVLFSLKE